MGLNFLWCQILGGFFDCSHLTELKNMYITEIYRKKKCKASII